MSDTTILLTVLGSVFAFILIVFVLMVSCFTWRKRRQHRSRTAGHDRLVEARFATRMQELPKSSTANGSSSTRQGRWTNASKQRDLGDIDEEGRHLSQRDETLDAAENPFTDEYANSAEWGATVNEDGTRSYLNGWFALDRPTLTISSLSSSGSGTSDASGRGRHRRIDSEWELDSNASDKDNDADYLESKQGRASFDAEAYRPPHEQ